MTDIAKIPLYVFAKPPIAGTVKTRLHTHCSPAQAAQIAAILLSETIRRCSVYWPGELILSVGSSPKHPLLQALSAQYNLKIVRQSDGDLGKRMLHTFELPASPAAIIGADVALITQSSLAQAHAGLSQKKNVIGPSEDGGYYLIGLVEASAPLFEDVNWGTSNVMAQTLSRAKAHKVELARLEVIRDIDEWPDVVYAAQQIPALANYVEQQRIV
jgi:rSAM/selenodomain-associated transferase 1